MALDIRFLVSTFGKHPQFYRFKFKKGEFYNHQNTNEKQQNDQYAALPAIYVYDSYLINPVQWKNVLQAGITAEKNLKIDGLLFFDLFAN